MPSLQLTTVAGLLAAITPVTGVYSWKGTYACSSLGGICLNSSDLEMEKTCVFAEKANTEKGSGESKNKEQKLTMHPSCSSAKSNSSSNTEAGEFVAFPGEMFGSGNTALSWFHAILAPGGGGEVLVRFPAVAGRLLSRT